MSFEIASLASSAFVQFCLAGCLCVGVWVGLCDAKREMSAVWPKRRNSSNVRLVNSIELHASW